MSFILERKVVSRSNCVNIGIGRELYTAPFIWINAANCNISQEGGKLKCTDRFEVSDIGYNEHREINRLVIVNARTKSVVFEYGTGKRNSNFQGETKPKPPVNEQTMTAVNGNPATEEQKSYIRQHASDTDYMAIMAEFGMNLENLSEADARHVIGEIDRNNTAAPTCTRCHNAVTDAVLPDGSTMTAAEVIGKSKATYGAVYCWNCAKALKRASRKRETENGAR